MARNPTLKRVRAWQAKQAKEDPAVDAGLAAGGLLLLTWLVLHPLVLAEWSVIGTLGAALGAGLTVGFGGVLVGLVVSGLTGWRHGGVAGAALLVAGLAALCLRWYPPVFAAAVLAVGEGALALGYWRAGVHRARSPFGLPAAVEAALAALPPDLSAGLEARLDAALQRQHQLAGLLAAAAARGVSASLGTERAAGATAGVQTAAETALLALVHQVAVQQRLAELPGAAPALEVARAEAEAALAALDAGLEGLVATSARVLATGQAAALAALRAEASALQLSAQAWAEVEAAVGERAA